MKIIFWIGLLLEGGVLLWALFRAWSIYTGKFVSTDFSRYRDILLPLIVSTLTFFGALIAQYYFHSFRAAFHIVLSPFYVLVIVAAASIIALFFKKSPWR